MNLTTLALLEIVKGCENLHSVIECVEGKEVLLDASFQSPTFWYKIVEDVEERLWYEYFQYPNLSQRRADIKGGKEWYEYAKAIDAGIVYRLGIRRQNSEEFGTDGIWDPKVIIPHSIARYDRSQEFEIFDLHGTRPKKGVKGCLFKVYQYQEGRDEGHWYDIGKFEVFIAESMEESISLAKYSVCKKISETKIWTEFNNCILRIDGYPHGQIDYGKNYPSFASLMSRWQDKKEEQVWRVGFYDSVLSLIAEIIFTIDLIEVEF